ARLWRDQGLTRLKISVNVSTRQLREPDFLQRVQRILQEGKYDPATNALCLEITESEVMKNVGRTIEMLRELKRLRLSISVDDFGTG
ncbi:MAG: EAL domain-containing protein, partial [Betaproteobacteria bacterium]|nr:EAL domain-containing protein [Betaproteobacteria bacterium]